MSNIKTSLYRRSNGFWYVSVVDGDGRTQWMSTKCRNRNDALQFLTKLKPFEKKSQKKKLSTFITDFHNYAVGTYAENTVELYDRYLDRFKKYIGDVNLDAVSVADIDRYKAYRLRTVKPNTASMELRTIKAAFSYAVKWGLIKSNPCVQSKLPKAPDTAPNYFTKAEFERFYTTLEDPLMREIVLFTINTGMRRGEVINLKWSDVDLKRRVVQIQSTGTFVTKTGKRHVVPMNDSVYQLLQHRQELKSGDFVFHVNGQMVVGDWIGHKFQKHIRNGNFNRKLHFHSLRHTCASWLAAGGVSIFQISRLLGHSTVNTTEQYYAHLSTDNLRDVVNQLSMVSLSEPTATNSASQI